MTSALEENPKPDDKKIGDGGQKVGAAGDKKDPRWALFFGILIGLAVICLALFGWSVSSVPLLLAELLVGFAAACFGGLLGFLFGLPRALVRDEGENEPGYVPNTNLETISDWLTKILIGVGLVQLREIGTVLRSIVAITLGSIGQPPPAGTEIVAYAVIITFLLLGFLFGYLWTRIVYTRLQTETDDSLTRLLLKNFKDLKQEVKEQKSATESLESDVSKQKDLTEILVTGDISSGKLQTSETSTGNVEEMGSRAGAKSKPLPPEIADKLERFKDAPATWASNPGADLFRGAKSEANGRRLEGTVLSKYSSSLLINLRVVETDPNRPLKDRVTFLLHPTFPTRFRHVEPRNRKADITIRPGGWFTVVAIVEEDPATVLSLDLREVPGVPQWFKES